MISHWDLPDGDQPSKKKQEKNKRARPIPTPESVSAQANEMIDDLAVKQAKKAFNQFQAGKRL